MAERNSPDIRGLCLDVDGVLTDGRLSWDDAGRSGRVFHVHDGLAIDWYQQLGGVVLICSGKTSAAVAARAAELKIPHVLQGSRDKVVDVRGCISPLGLRLDQLAVMGDDLPDVPLMKRCGFPIAVASAVEEVKSVARLVTRQGGGDGAVREAIEHLLRLSGKWKGVLEHYGIGVQEL